jgi:hypothetical protein
VPLGLILALCMGGIACLTPFTLYLIWLGYVNKRDRPTVVSGVWDFVALLLGLSGFGVAAGVVVLSATMGLLRQFNAANFRDLSKSWGADHTTWLVLFAGGVMMAVALIGSALVRRRNTLSVYTVSLPALEDAVSDTLAGLGLTAKRFGDGWSDGRPLVEIVPFHVFRFVTVRLLAPDARLVNELDRNLRVSLGVVPATDNPAARWVMSACICSFVTDLCFVALILAATTWAN